MPTFIRTEETTFALIVNTHYINMTWEERVVLLFDLPAGHNHTQARQSIVKHGRPSVRRVQMFSLLNRPCQSERSVRLIEKTGNQLSLP